MAGAGDVARRPSYEELEGRVAVQDALIGELRAQIAELRLGLRASSRNSSRPPSSDGLSKPNVDAKKRSLRRSSGRCRGGQDGHEGARLEPVVAPDVRVEHSPGRCDGCGGDLAGGEVLEGGERRQVFDLPEGALLRVVEHVAQRRRCGCGCVTAGGFPGAVAAPTQYGPGVRALGVYLVAFQHLPYDRSCLHGLLRAAEVCHFDETGARIGGGLGWVHSASTDRLTRYTVHARRGGEAIDDAGVLPGFGGVAVHDGWAPYRNYDACRHGLCNIHHLRELQGAREAGHVWPLAMSCLLLDTKDLVERSRAAGHERLGAAALAEVAASYRTIIKMGHDEHPATSAKQAKAHNLLLRLERYQDDVLRFACDFRVPFGNNQAEQDIRMVKLQQKISGCWRTTHGAERFLRVRSYISTARKHELAALDVLGQLGAGQPWLPAAAPG